MKKHSSIFFIITAFVLITLACNSLSTVPAAPQQPGQPPQRPEQPFSQPGQPDGQPGQQPGQPGQQPGQPGQQPGQPGQQPRQPGQPEQSRQQPGQPGGQGPASSAPIQIDKTVTIPGKGGSAEITFDISNGQWTHIVLTAGDPGMQPYGSMQYPDGISVDCPPITTTANGTNQADILLTDPGRYTLTLFDGSNRGGSVSVKVVALK